ncbi:MAG: hypothetical protein ACR2H7_01915 [Actinomycetota bacterium]
MAPQHESCTGNRRNPELCNKRGSRQTGSRHNERYLGVSLTTSGRRTYTQEQQERLRHIQARLTEARRELDALIGDAYLRPRASIVPVHFLDLASATEKLRWAEKEWRELEREIDEGRESDDVVIEDRDELDPEAFVEVGHAEGSRR